MYAPGFPDRYLRLEATLTCVITHLSTTVPHCRDFSTAWIAGRIRTGINNAGTADTRNNVRRCGRSGPKLAKRPGWER
jgi:hypothetical protein